MSLRAHLIDGCHPSISPQVISAKGMLNMCGLSSRMPEFAAKIDVYMLTLCSAIEDLARNEKEAVQVRWGLADVNKKQQNSMWWVSIHRNQCLMYCMLVCISFNRPISLLSATARRHYFKKGCYVFIRSTSTLPRPNHCYCCAKPEKLKNCTRDRFLGQVHMYCSIRTRVLLRQSDMYFPPFRLDISLPVYHMHINVATGRRSCVEAYRD